MKFINLGKTKILIIINNTFSYFLEPLDIQIVNNTEKFINLEIYNQNEHDIFSSIIPFDDEYVLKINESNILFNDTHILNFEENLKFDLFLNYILLLIFLYVIYFSFFNFV